MKRAYLILSLIALVCVMGLSQSSAQRRKRPKAQASPTATPTPTPSPTPTPPAKRLGEIAETIKRYNAGDEAGAYEETVNFKFSPECAAGCKDCKLDWYFQVYEETDKPDAPRKVEAFKVEVNLASINPKRVYVQGTQVRFGTNDGQTISVTIPAGSMRAARIVDGKPSVNAADVIDKTDSWRISVRDEDGAKAVKVLLKKVLEDSCPKP